MTLRGKIGKAYVEGLRLLFTYGEAVTLASGQSAAQNTEVLRALLDRRRPFLGLTADPAKFEQNLRGKMDGNRFQLSRNVSPVPIPVMTVVARGFFDEEDPPAKSSRVHLSLRMSPFAEFAGLLAVVFLVLILDVIVIGAAQNAWPGFLAARFFYTFTLVGVVLLFPLLHRWRWLGELKEAEADFCRLFKAKPAQRAPLGDSPAELFRVLKGEDWFFPPSLRRGGFFVRLCLLFAVFAAAALPSQPLRDPLPLPMALSLYGEGLVLGSIALQLVFYAVAGYCIYIWSMARVADIGSKNAFFRRAHIWTTALFGVTMLGVLADKNSAFTPFEGLMAACPVAALAAGYLAAMPSAGAVAGSGGILRRLAQGAAAVALAILVFAAAADVINSGGHADKVLAAAACEGVTVAAQDAADIRRAAESGDGRAQYRFARLLQVYGGGLDNAEALDWYKKSAAQGYAPAQFELGRAFDAGTGPDADPAAAKKWYALAADQGDTNAENNLGYLYDMETGAYAPSPQGKIWMQRETLSYAHVVYHGNGGDLDAKQAQKFLKAAAAGDAAAQYNLAMMDSVIDSLGATPAEAAKWMQKSAAQGYAPAQEILGSWYLKGYGVAKDEKKALQLRLAAAGKGYPEAEFSLGVDNERGSHLPQDDKAAAEWYGKAAAQGHAEAAFALARLYADGAGVPEDPGAAFVWFARAAADGRSALWTGLYPRCRAAAAHLGPERLQQVLKKVADWTPEKPKTP